VRVLTGVFALISAVAVPLQMPSATATATARNGSTATTASSDVLPDLGMARLADIQLDLTSSPGRRLLRFTTIIVNVGAGAFELEGQRPDSTAPTMTVTQRIYDSSGAFRDVATGASMYYAGDGHNHWHVRDLESYSLNRLDNGAVVGTGVKHGFCFSDNVRYRLTLPGAPISARYAGCGTASSLSVTVGLSVGWGDRYSYNLVDQYIDATGLKAGKYRLNATADPNHWFAEQNISNNATWVDLKLTRNDVTVLAYGPSA
jgi:hypothetical protein